jgi:FkbM family methyltransferase
VKLKYPVRRFVHTSQAAAQLLRNVNQDMRMLLRRWHDGAAVRQRRLEGGSILVRADEDPGRDIYFFGCYEERDSEFVLHNIRECDICFDVGANVGYYTVMLAHFAKHGSVHSFEPVPLSYHLLSANVLINKLNNVVVNRCAVGDHDGVTDFVVATDTAFSSMRDTGRRSVDEAITVPLVTLDTYCESRGIERIDFLKADVEGAEEFVVRGAARLLADAKRRPRLIMLELHDPMLQRYQCSIERVLSILRGHGYEAFVCQNSGLVTFTPEQYGVFYNVCFLPESNSRN